MDFIFPSEYDNLDIEYYKQLNYSAIQLLKSIPNYVVRSANSPVLFVGDLHGYLECAKVIENLVDKYNPDLVVFLGDYVDRGEHQFKTLQYVLEFFVKNNHRVVLLRGNHEFEQSNDWYGFHNELEKHFKSNYEEVKQLCNNVFNYLSLAFKSGDYIGLHAGIPSFGSLTDLDNIPKPHHSLNSPEANIYNLLMEEIVWNDPRVDVQGFEKSTRGGNAKFFGMDSLEHFLKVHNAKHLIRSHESSRGDFSIFWEGKLIQIFSAAPYPPKNERPKVNNSTYGLKTDKGQFIILNDKGEILRTI